MPEHRSLTCCWRAWTSAPQTPRVAPGSRRSCVADGKSTTVRSLSSRAMTSSLESTRPIETLQDPSCGPARGAGGIGSAPGFAPSFVSRLTSQDAFRTPRSTWVKAPYAVWYTTASAVVVVWAIGHQHREPGYWTERKNASVQLSARESRCDGEGTSGRLTERCSRQAARGGGSSPMEPIRAACGLTLSRWCAPTHRSAHQAGVTAAAYNGPQGHATDEVLS